MKYLVTLDGKKYEVEVERIDAAEHTVPAYKAPENKVTQEASAMEGSPVLSPMPGTILDVKVSAGQAVKKGQVLMILEAMKMENEIMADRDAVVENISASKGASVNTGDILLTLK